MKPVTVLYADDDENDAFFMERAFARLDGHSRLRVVTNGVLAVKYLSGAGAYADRDAFPLPALLLLDVKMPHMSGLEVLKWTRAQREFDHLPVVMFSSSTQQADIDFCATHGASAYLVKPSRADQLSDLVPQVVAAALDQESIRRKLDLPGNQLPEPMPGE